MTEPVASREVWVLRGLAVVVLAAVYLRLAVAVVGGFLEWHSGLDAGGRIEAYDVLATFGAAGDLASVLLVFAAGGLLWWLSGRGEPLPRWMRTAALVAFVLTGLLAALDGIGAGILFGTVEQMQYARAVLYVGLALAVTMLAGAGALAMHRLDALSDELLLEGGDGTDALVFAVDRGTGNVRAFFSIGEAARRTHFYSVEDDEFAFYTDEGAVLEATVEHGRVMLRPTDVNQLSELQNRLKAFVNRRGIAIDAQDADDPTAYAVPISDWQWLQNWPPWMRGLGRLFRPRLKG